MTMKNIQLSLCAVFMVASSLHTVDIPEHVAWCGKQIKIYGNNLLHDTTTQAASLTSVMAVVGCYQYYHYHAALVCLDGHPNSRIMHKSNLIYMTYSDFIGELAVLNSYAAVSEFVYQYASSCGTVSDAKINKFIALVDDLQKNNEKRLSDAVEQENIILKNFKNNLIILQKNKREELINNTINTNNNALKLYNLRQIAELFNIFFSK